MEINTYVTNTNFEDLHIHTDYSFSDGEYMNMNLKPEELLEEVRVFAEKNNCKVTIAVTDHNSISAPQIMTKLIKNDPEKYKNINLITGCEFSTFVNLTTPKGKIYRLNFHMLAYDFDINDETLKYYTELQSIESGKFVYSHKLKDKIPMGSIVLAGKRYLKSKGMAFPLSVFTDFKLLDGRNDQDFSTVILNAYNFSDYCMDYLGIDEKTANDMYKYILCLPDQLNNTKKSKNRIIQREIFPRDISINNLRDSVKLGAAEIMGIVESSGGRCVLAHPGAIMEHCLESKAIKLNAESFEELKELKMQARKDFIKDFVNHLLNAKDPITDRKLKGIVGIELMHYSNSTKQTFEYLVELARKHNLYLTGGSDKHGNLVDILSLGQVLLNYMEYAVPKPNKKKVSYMLHSSQFSQDILNKRNLVRKVGNDRVEVVRNIGNGNEILDLDQFTQFIQSKAGCPFHSAALSLGVNGYEKTEYDESASPFYDNNESPFNNNSKEPIYNNHDGNENPLYNNHNESESSFYDNKRNENLSNNLEEY